MLPDDDFDDDDFEPRPELNPAKVAMQILEAARGESIEAAISAACELVYCHWQESTLEKVLREWGATDDDIDPLRVVSRTGARNMATVIESTVPHIVDGHHLVFEELLAARMKRVTRAGLNYASSAGVAELMAELVGTGERLLDPACGLAGSLLASAKRHPRSNIAGVDISREAAAFAVRRLRLAGANPDVSAYDWLGAEPSGEWDAIVVEPPMGTKIDADYVADLFVPLRTSGSAIVDGDGVWLNAVRASLSPHGRGVVLLPAGAASRGGNTGRMRAELLESGRVEAIISLPPGMVPYTGIATNVWIVSGREDRRKGRHVLLVNGRASIMDPAIESALIDIPMVVNVTLPWLDEGTSPEGPSWFARTVDITTLVADGDASPQRHLGIPPELALPRPPAPGHLLTELRLEGFKAVDEPAKVPLRPLTLIYGKNSAGKSSLIQAMLLMKQSITENNLVANGSLTNLGSFAGIVHNHDENRVVSIGLSFSSTPDLDSSSVLPDPRRVRSVDFSFVSDSDGRSSVTNDVRLGLADKEFTWTRANPETFVVDNESVVDLIDLAYTTDSVYPPRKASTGQQGSRVGRELARHDLGSVEFSADGLLPGSVSAEYLASVAHRTAATSRRGLTEAALRTASALMSSLGEEAKRLLDRTTYLGPLRKAPERLNTRSEKAGELDVPFFLLDNTSERKDISDRLQRLGVNYDLDAVTVSDPADRNLFGDIAAIVLTDTRTGLRLSPADVGFGISQVLPIVTELSARTNSVILIEQPEIHLHPAMQADLADLLIESVDENGRANQVIAETHSENIMLRLQRRIREGVFSSNDVAVLYVDQDDDGAALLRELRLDSDGDFIDAWPHGFFVERFDELFGGEL